jgi:hypothetical protein
MMAMEHRREWAFALVMSASHGTQHFFSRLVPPLIPILLVVLGRRFALRAGDEPPGPLVGYDRAAPGPDSVGGSALVCPACGSHNDPGYRFCHSCVSRLAVR